ncbi:MAG TPA: paraquat-inducible protein A [Thiopseudomonas sp.]|nr:paraquat-inducible protein A [Thiopseudomonas sp.]
MTTPLPAQELTEDIRACPAGSADSSSVSRRRLRVCHECDLLLALPPLKTGEKANCPRCNHTLVRRQASAAERSLALAIATLIMLGLSLSFPFLGFSLQGFGNGIALTETVSSLVSFEQSLVALTILLTVIILPLLYLTALSWLCVGIIRGQPLPKSPLLARTLNYVTPWMMADVFVIGTLVSMIKIVGMAEVELGLSFWTVCGYALLLLFTTQSVDRDWLWQALDATAMAPTGGLLGQAAAPQGLTGCNTCGLVNQITAGGRCERCDEPLHPYQGVNTQTTLALLGAAIVMFIPANLYPIMISTSLGSTEPATILAGVLMFFQSGDWPIALVILIASIVVPVGKMLSLLWLCFVVQRQQQQPMGRLTRNRLYRLTEFIGRWSMVDVFVVAILVALIHSGDLISIAPGPAALAFTSVVILTMLSAMMFDPRSIWQPDASAADSTTTTSTQLPHSSSKEHL